MEKSEFPLADISNDTHLRLGALSKSWGTSHLKCDPSPDGKDMIDGLGPGYGPLGQQGQLGQHQSKHTREQDDTQGW